MQLGALVVDINGRRRGERGGLPSTGLSAATCVLEYARCQLNGQGTVDERPPSTAWTMRQHWRLFELFLQHYTILEPNVDYMFCLDISISER